MDRNILLQLEADELLLEDIALYFEAIDFHLRYEIDEEIIAAEPQWLQVCGERLDRGLHLVAALSQSLAFLSDAEEHDVLVGLDIHEHVALYERARAGRGQLVLCQHVFGPLALLGPGLAL